MVKQSILKYLNKIRQDRRGNINVYIVAIIAIGMGILFWWLFGLMFDAYDEFVAPNYTVTGIGLDGLNLVRVIGSIGLPVAILIAAIFYSINQSKVSRYEE